MTIELFECVNTDDTDSLLQAITDAVSISDLALMLCEGECEFKPYTKFTIVLPDTCFTLCDQGIVDNWQKLVNQLEGEIDGTYNELPNDSAYICANINRNELTIFPYGK